MGIFTDLIIPMKMASISSLSGGNDGYKSCLNCQKVIMEMRLKGKKNEKEDQHYQRNQLKEG